MDSKKKEEELLRNIMIGILSKKEVEIGSIKNSISKECYKNISELNVQRGGEGLKGFVFENLHVKDLNNGFLKNNLNFKAEVVDNNGLADIVIKNTKTGNIVKKIQTKTGYETGSDLSNFTKYIEDGQELVINGDSVKFAERLDKSSIEYTKSNITDKECSNLAKKMQNESKITGTKNSNIVSKVENFKDVAKNSHASGINAAKKGALFGAGLSLGVNTVEVLSGEKEIKEAVVDVAKDTAISGVAGYAVGSVGTALASTAAGTAVIGATTTAVTAVGTAVAGTAVGGAAIAAGGTAIAAGTSAVAAIGTAAAATATAAGTAVARTAVGAAAIGAATTVGTAVAGTAVGGAAIAAGAAIGAVAVAAAPIVAAGAILGGAFAVGRKIFGKRR